MKKITGSINGMDVQTRLPRTQIFVVESPRQTPDVQVTTYDDGIFCMLALASLLNTEVTVEYDESKSERLISAVYAKDLERLEIAVRIAKLKNVKAEDTTDGEGYRRVVIIDRVEVAKP